MEIKIIGDELWFNGLKVGVLVKSGIPSMDAAVRLHLIKMLTGNGVQGWRP